MKGFVSFKKLLSAKFNNPNFKKNFDKFCVKDIVLEFFKEVDLKEYIKEVKVREDNISIVCSNFLVSNKINTLKKDILAFLNEKGEKKEYIIKIRC